jgi:PAT family beta-lactamase induction signal transducer AmpG
VREGPQRAGAALPPESRVRPHRAPPLAHSFRPAAPRRAHAGDARLLVVTLLGFASGLPLALTGQALQAWLTLEGVDIATIGFLSLVGLPYTFKFLWAPLMDRFDLPWLGRRRGWLVLTQLLLAGALLALAATSPSAIRAFALLAVAVAFVSASAGRGDRRLPHRPAAAARARPGRVAQRAGYRLAMIVSGGVALIWTDPRRGGGWTWPEVYR